jgi:hypothetical protein
MILIGAGTLAGCGARRPEVPAPAHPPAPVPSVQPSVPPGAQQYVIDAGRSVVTLRVFRAGPLARLGHNHVITSAAESGSAWTAATLDASGFEVRVLVAALEVDEPAARSAAGPDFPGVVPEDAREGTRRNMLRPEVLDADRYPEVIVRARSLGGSWQSPVAHAEVTLRDHVRRIDVPLTVTWSPGAVTARGGFRILQSDFGITPFSVGGGAIQVADAVDVEFEFSAVAP